MGEQGQHGQVLIIADLHLQAERPDITRAFISFLEQHACTAERLYILGDLFESWVGDDVPCPEFTPVFTALRQCTQAGCQVFFQHGNRDFLVGPNLLARMGASLLQDEVVVQLPIGPALLLHGDQLCLDDQDYQVFRQQVRNPVWQEDFLAKPLNERLAVARQLRATSQVQTANKAMAIMDVSQSAVELALAQAHVPLLIHGHTHRPAVHSWNTPDQQPQMRIVLGDWDSHLWYLQCDTQGIALVDEPIT